MRLFRKEDRLNFHACGVDRFELQTVLLGDHVVGRASVQLKLSVGWFTGKSRRSSELKRSEATNSCGKEPVMMSNGG